MDTYQVAEELLRLQNFYSYKALKNFLLFFLILYIPADNGLLAASSKQVCKVSILFSRFLEKNRFE